MITDDSIDEKLLGYGLRATAQRSSLYALMHEIEPRHFTAGQLYDFAVERGLSVSLATVYNNIKAFQLAGLVKNIAINGYLSVYDTDVEPHAHTYNETTGEFHDLGPSYTEGLNLKVPDGYEVSAIQLVFTIKAQSPS